MPDYEIQVNLLGEGRQGGKRQVITEVGPDTTLEEIVEKGLVKRAQEEYEEDRYNVTGFLEVRIGVK